MLDQKTGLFAVQNELFDRFEPTGRVFSEGIDLFSQTVLVAHEGVVSCRMFFLGEPLVDVEVGNPFEFPLDGGEPCLETARYRQSLGDIVV